MPIHSETTENMPGKEALDLARAREERCMLAAFLDGERLRGIPAGQKKRRILLRWLAADFAPGRRYPEAEVNAILQRHHSDCAYLRRALVVWGHLRRAAGIDWRSESEDQP
jgi:hypothetical protein